MVAGVLASLAELELELGRERRAAAREARRARGQAIGRPKALDASKAALARRMHSSGEPVSTIAKMMANRHIHRVIVRRGMKVAGIISALDVLRVFDGGTARSPKPKVKVGVKAKTSDKAAAKA